MLGLMLQLSSLELAILAGRFAYGWGLFQAMVRLDLLLFHESQRSAYSVDFSKINSFQGLGVLAASFAAGGLVSAFGLRVPFGVAVGGFALGCVVYASLFAKELKHAFSEAVRGAQKTRGVAT
jgi:MFS transporter, DHA1 family, multidrug resistance protein